MTTQDYPTVGTAETGTSTEMPTATDVSPTSTKMLTPTDASPTSVNAEPQLGLITRTRLFVGTSKTRAVETVERLEKQRGGNRFIDAAFGSVETNSEAGGDLLVGAVAFRFFLMFIPFVFVVVLGIGVGGDLTGKSASEIAKSGGMGALVVSSVNVGGESSKSFRVIGLIIVVYALLSGARKLLRSLMAVHSLMWHVPFVKLRRPFLGGAWMILAMAAAMVVSHFIARLRTASLIGWLFALVAFIVIPATAWLISSVPCFRLPFAQRGRTCGPALRCSASASAPTMTSRLSEQRRGRWGRERHSESRPRL